MQSKAHLFRLLKISRSKQRTYSVTDQVLQHSTKKLNNQTLIINRFDYYYYYITLAPHILTGNLKQFLKKLNFLKLLLTGFLSSFDVMILTCHAPLILTSIFLFFFPLLI